MKKLTHFEFVKIKPGKFMMGSPDIEQNRFSDETQREVELTESFEMQTTPVTQETWKTVMGTTPSYFKGKNLPVESVSWDDVQKFIAKLNELDPGYTYRLPTEAEWEYACRAGSTQPYSCDEDELETNAWFCNNSDQKTHAVGQKKPNAWGLFDMMGNIWEWCDDWYGKYERS